MGVEGNMYRCEDRVFHEQEGRPPVFVAGKGDLIKLEVAQRLGLVVEDKKVRGPRGRKVEGGGE